LIDIFHASLPSLGVLAMKSHCHAARRPAAFTLVELLVVIAIIGALIGLLLPAVQRAREASRRTSCQGKIKQLSLALLNYESINGALPPTVWDNSPLESGAGVASSNIPGLPWSCLILPFLEGNDVYDQVASDTNQFTQCWNQGTVTDGLAKRPRNDFECPSNNDVGKTRSDGYGKMNYTINAGIGAYVQWRSGAGGSLMNQLGPAGTTSGTRTSWQFNNVFMPSLGGSAHCTQASQTNQYNNGVTIPYWERKAMPLQLITDGVSKTMLLSEKTATLTGQVCPSGTCIVNQGIWLIAKLSTTAGKAWEIGVQTNTFESYAGSSNVPNATNSMYNFAEAGSSPHQGGIFISFADGATRWIDDTISSTTYRQLRSRCDEQVIADY
jgi:prepilin-type N-terminal cleavage/methylation domain-containing protein